jgi:hypothetical protein
MKSYVTFGKMFFLTQTNQNLVEPADGFLADLAGALAFSVLIQH